jgi:predicted ATPase/DNA-binding CsgD family transcriptional regulator
VASRREARQFLVGAADEVRGARATPQVLTTFVGRSSEVERVTSLLAAGVRLLTLTGPGGVGKTRLALEVGRRAASAFQGGVRFVPLGHHRDAQLVPKLTARALGLDAEAPLPAEPLNGDRRLLVYDNFEHVTAAAPFVVRLLESAPSLQVLATSRESLHVSGERELLVQPLPVREAVALFVQRARAIRHDFVLTDENDPVVAEICDRLEGLPLAVELAAARVRILSPQAILARLDRPLELLTDGARDLPPRQRTLRDTIAWSYSLLSPYERRLFGRLAGFAGCSRLESAEQVCALGDDGPRGHVLDALASLVERNLLRRVHYANGEVRLAMLDTVREFALDCLATSAEEREIRDAHAAIYVELAETAALRDGTPDEQHWLELVETDLKNIRAAFLWSLDSGDTRTALRLARALAPFWRARGLVREGERWVAAARAAAGQQAPLPDGLTEREAEVLRLLAAGLSNRRIADRLVVSVRTVHAHVRSIYRKLDLGSRVDAARYAVEHELVPH